MSFQDGAAAGAATIITTTGATAIGTQPFQGTFFFGAATGGTSRQILTSGGLLDITGLVFSTAAVTVGSIEGSGVVAIGGTTLTVGANDLSTTFSGVIQNLGNRTGSDAHDGSLVKIGAGTLTLTGANTYTGGTTFAGGVLNVGSARALGTTGTLSFTGGTLQYSAANRTDYSSRFSTTANQLYSIDTNGQNVTFATGLTSAGGSLTKLGAGTLTLTGANTYTGGTTLSAGTLAVGNSAALGTGALTFASGTTLQAAANGLSLANAMTLNGTDTIDTQTNALTLAGTISGTGGLTKIGSGTLTLTGASTYSGGTTLSAGTLAVGNSAALGTGALTFASGTTLRAAANGLSLANAMTLNGTSTVDTQANALTLSGNIVGTGGLSKIGAGTLTLAGPSSYTGATNVNAGTLQAGVANAFAPLSAFTVASGATLDLNGFSQSIGSLAGAASVTLGAATLTTGNDNTSTTFSGAISGSGGLTKIGSGTLTLSGSTTYAGATAVNAGTLQAGAANAFSAISAYTIASGATLDLNNFNQRIGSLAGAGAITLGAATLATGIDNTSTTFSGGISGTGGLTKAGSGTMTLSGSSSYSGATAVNAGTLTVNGSIANSAVTVNSGATLNGTGTVGGLTIMSGSMFAPGNSPGTMTVAGNLAFQSGALYVVQVNPSTASSTSVTSGGIATLAGSVQAAFAAGSYATRTYTILSAAGGLGGTTFNTLTTSNLPAGFTASLSYTATDAILNLTATLGQLVVPSAPSGPSALACAFSLNQCNVANALNAFFNNGGALPGNFLPIFNLTGANLASALTLLSGEAATGAQQGAFQLTNQFLGVMLDPFVDGRGGVGGGGAIGFAPARAELPEDIALAYAKILKEPPKPIAFDQRWSVWGAGYGGSNRTSGDPTVLGSHDLSAATAGGAAGLDYRLAPGTVGGLRACRRRHELGSGAGAGRGQERCVPGRALRHGALGFRLSRRRPRLHQSLDVDRPLRLCRRSSQRELQRAVVRRPRGKRLSHCDVLRRAHALRRDPGTKLPYAVLQRDRSHQRRFCARL
jgi:autotransporter-associated beta strand protein